MIEVALESGFDAYGIEFSEPAIKAASAEVQKRIYRNDINDFDNLKLGTFDIITAFDILEHTQDPVACLRKWAESLNRGGILVLSTPDTDHYLRTILGRKWPMLQPFQHTFLFSGSRFGDVFSSAGLKPVTVVSAEKIMTLKYLLGQVEIHLPAASRLGRSVGKLIPGLMKKPIPFKIGEFLAVGRKEESTGIEN